MKLLVLFLVAELGLCAVPRTFKKLPEQQYVKSPPSKTTDDKEQVRSFPDGYNGVIDDVHGFYDKETLEKYYMSSKGMQYTDDERFMKPNEQYKQQSAEAEDNYNPTSKDHYDATLKDHYDPPEDNHGTTLKHNQEPTLGKGYDPTSKQRYGSILRKRHDLTLSHRYEPTLEEHYDDGDFSYDEYEDYSDYEEEDNRSDEKDEIHVKRPKQADIDKQRHENNYKEGNYDNDKEDVPIVPDVASPPPQYAPLGYPPPFFPFFNPFFGGYPYGYFGVPYGYGYPGYRYAHPATRPPVQNTKRGETFLCPADGYYYRDGSSFYQCYSGDFSVQLCAPGSMNYAVGYYSKGPGHEYDMKDFCAINMASYPGYAPYNPPSPYPHQAPPTVYPNQYAPGLPYLYLSSVSPITHAQTGGITAPTAPAASPARAPAAATPAAHQQPEVTSYDNSAEAELRITDE